MQRARSTAHSSFCSSRIADQANDGAFIGEDGDDFGLPLDPWLIDELDLEPGEVDLRLVTRWRFKGTSKPAGREGRNSRTRSRTTL